MRVLHVYQSPSFSGAEAYALEVALHQSKNFDVSFVVKKAAPLEARVRAASSEIKIETKLADVNLANFDVVILHSTQELKHHWPRLALAKIKAKLGGVRAPRVIVYTHIWISHSKRDPIHAIPYGVVDQVWTSSEQARAALEKVLPIGKSHIDVVRYGRDIKAFDSSLLSKHDAREKLGLPQNAVVVGTIARVDKGKGSREFFDAVTDLMQSRADLHLVMIGPATSGDPKATELDQAIDRDIAELTPQIRARIYKKGRIENATALMRAFDLFVLATYKENFALTLLEAMLAEVPCLATDSGGSPDVVHPHANGWLYWPESVKCLRETLLTALEQKDKWLDFGKLGRKFVFENYEFSQVMKTADEKLHSLVRPDSLS